MAIVKLHFTMQPDNFEHLVTVNIDEDRIEVISGVQPKFTGSISGFKAAIYSPNIEHTSREEYEAVYKEILSIIEQFEELLTKE